MKEDSTKKNSTECMFSESADAGPEEALPLAFHKDPVEILREFIPMIRRMRGPLHREIFRLSM